MPNIISTIYKNGVFRPVTKVKLPENTRVDLTPLRDFSYQRSSKDLLEMFKYAQTVYKKAKLKISGLKFQKSIRKEADAKIKTRFDKLNA